MAFPEDVLHEMMNARESARRDRALRLAGYPAQGLIETGEKHGLVFDASHSLLAMIEMILDVEYPNMFEATGTEATSSAPHPSWFGPESGPDFSVVAEQPTEQYRDMVGQAIKPHIEPEFLAQLLRQLHNGGAHEAYLSILREVDRIGFDIFNADVPLAEDDVPYYVKIDDLRQAIHAVTEGLLGSATQEYLIEAIVATATCRSQEAMVRSAMECRRYLGNILDAEFVERQLRLFMAEHWSSGTVDSVVRAAVHVPGVNEPATLPTAEFITVSNGSQSDFPVRPIQDNPQA